MAGTTTKLSLYLPGGGSSGLVTPDEQVDIDKINDNMKKIDAAIGFVVCTSGTRPSTPFTGQSIIETDTRNTLYWNGSRWVPMDTLPNAGSDAIRGSLFPAPVAGNMVFRTDYVPSFFGGVIQIFSNGVWRNLIAGRIAAIPTSAAGTGVVVLGSRVQFTNNLLDLNIYGCFTDEFDLYEITMVFDAASPVGLTARFINDGSVIDAAANYGWVRHFTTPANVITADASSTLVTQMAILPVAAINGVVKMRITSPRSARAKLVDTDGSYFTATGNGGLFKVSNRYNTSNVNVGGIAFQFSAAASGNIYIEGLR